jgi:hypothetical protein
MELSEHRPPYGHGADDGRILVGPGKWMNGEQLGRALPSYGFNPEKFTSIKLYACLSGALEANSLAAGVSNVTLTPTIGTSWDVWTSSEGFLPFYENTSGGKGAPARWVCFGIGCE